MELHEAKQLIPMYVANTLTPEEKAEVDEALKVSKELNDDLAFWRKAQLAAQVHAEYATQHLSSEQIVDYAERAVSDPRLRSQLESHLQACKDCREEYEMIVQTMPEPEARRQMTPGMIEKIRGFITSLKPAYVLPALAVIIGVVVLWRGIEMKSVDENTARFVLPFQGQMRTEDESLPNLALNESVKQVQFVLCIPHDSLVSTKYTATLTTPAGTTITLPETFSKVVTPLTDSLIINLASESLRVEGEYTLNLAEVPSSLPPGASPFPPEPYRFNVLRKSDMLSP